MNLIFLETDKAFFDWVASALKGHHCTLAKTVEEAENVLVAEHYDACFVDMSAFGDSAAIVIARARVACRKCPLIMLTGKEARADLIKVCDGFVCKGSLTNPETEIPRAVEVVTKRQDAAHPMDLTQKLFNVVTALRLSAP
jgi:DNA-binding NtrC family response regulator